MFSASFTPVFTGKVGLQETEALRSESLEQVGPECESLEQVRLIPCGGC